MNKKVQWANENERYAMDEEYRERKKAHAKRRYELKRDEVRAYVFKYQWDRKVEAVNKLGGCCQKCGFDHPAALQFHHRDPSQKFFTIDTKSLSKPKKFPPEMVEAELAKCDLLCANCHFILHAVGFDAAV